MNLSKCLDVEENQKSDIVLQNKIWIIVCQIKGYRLKRSYVNYPKFCRNCKNCCIILKCLYFSFSTNYRKFLKSLKQ